MKNKKASTFLPDNFGWILLAILLLAAVLIFVFPSIAEGFENVINKLRNLR